MGVEYWEMFAMPAVHPTKNTTAYDEREAVSGLGLWLCIESLKLAMLDASAHNMHVPQSGITNSAAPDILLEYEPGTWGTLLDMSWKTESSGGRH